MYEAAGHVTAGLILLTMVAFAATLCGGAAMGLSYDRVTITFDIARTTKRAFVTFTMLVCCVLASLGATAWFGWKEGAFDGRDKRGGGGATGVASAHGEDDHRVSDLRGSTAVAD